MRPPYTLKCLGILLTLSTAARAVPASSPADSLYKGWYFTPSGVFGRGPLDHPKTRHFVRISHPSADLAVVQHINPAGITTGTSRIYFRDGLIALRTETNRWDDTYDSMWFSPDGPGKFLVTERRNGVNPFLPCKYQEYTYKNDLLTDVLCYVDSIRAGTNQEGVAHYVFERYADPDRRGLIRTEAFFSNIDAPVFSRLEDCHKIILEYDAKANLVSRSVYDDKDQKATDRYGVFRTKYKYDGDDNQTEALIYDISEKPTVNTQAWSAEYRDYRQGFLSQISYCVDINRPAVSLQLGTSVSFVDTKYDKEGNETEMAWFREDRSPVNNANNIQKVENLYSANGMLIRTNNFTLDRFGSLNKVSIAIRYGRDKKGRISDQHFETNTGVLFANPENGAMLTKFAYDAWGRVHSTSCWLNDTTKMSGAFGYHEVVNSYDNDGQLAERDFFDQNGAPTLGKIGYSKEIIHHNELGLTAEVSYFARDKPVARIPGSTITSGFHRMTYHYDQLNRLRIINFYDDAGHPVSVLFHTRQHLELKAQEIDLDYNGGLMSAQTLKDSGDTQLPVALDCSKGECLAVNVLGLANSNLANSSSPSFRAYHGKFRPDTLFDNQLGFVGHDSLLVFVTRNWARLTDLGCAEYYRLAPVNQYYQLDGRVTDYYLNTDSVAATFSYVAGFLDGPVYFYYPNGRVREKGYYRKNVKFGIWDYFYDNGQKERSIAYDDGYPLLQECYTKDGEVLAKGGNGRFEGSIASPRSQSEYTMVAKGTVQNGLPEGEWNLFTADHAGPANTEYFSRGTFKRGTSFGLLGSTPYRDMSYISFESSHSYETLDPYRMVQSCHADGMAPRSSDLYPQIKTGFANIVGTGKYRSYSGWIFVDVRVSGDGNVLDTHVRLYQPNDALEKDIRTMIKTLKYPASVSATGKSHNYDKLYVFLLGNDFAIPEEILEQQRSPRLPHFP